MSAKADTGPSIEKKRNTGTKTAFMGPSASSRTIYLGHSATKLRRWRTTCQGFPHGFPHDFTCKSAAQGTRSR